MACPREVKDIPCWVRVLIMMVSTIGSVTFSSDFQLNREK